MPGSEKASVQEDVIKYLRASLLLQLRQLSGDGSENLKPEILLNQAGFSHQEIADLLGKSYNAVKLTILRSKKNGKGNEA